MKILITGGSGFIGQNLLAKLIEEKHELVLTTRESSDWSFLSTTQQAYCQWLNLQHTASNHSELLNELDTIIHLATVYDSSNVDYHNLMSTNLLLPMSLIEQVLKHRSPVKKPIHFINTDTFFVLADESYPYMPNYIHSKRDILKWLKFACNQQLINLINLRLFHPFGDNDGENKFIIKMIKSCLKESSLDLTAGTQKRDFIYIEDVVNSFLCCLKQLNNLSGFHHFDVGLGSCVSIKSMVSTIHQLTHSRTTLNFGALSERAGEFQDVPANIKSLKNIGWSPQHSIEEGLQKTYDYVKNNL